MIFECFCVALATQKHSIKINPPQDWGGLGGVDNLMANRISYYDKLSQLFPTGLYFERFYGPWHALSQSAMVAELGETPVAALRPDQSGKICRISFSLSMSLLPVTGKPRSLTGIFLRRGASRSVPTVCPCLSNRWPKRGLRPA